MHFEVDVLSDGIGRPVPLVAVGSSLRIRLPVQLLHHFQVPRLGGHPVGEEAPRLLRVGQEELAALSQVADVLDLLPDHLVQGGDVLLRVVDVLDELLHHGVRGVLQLHVDVVDGELLVQRLATDHVVHHDGVGGAEVRLERLQQLRELERVHGEDGPESVVQVDHLLVVRVLQALRLHVVPQGQQHPLLALDLSPQQAGQHGLQLEARRVVEHLQQDVALDGAVVAHPLHHDPVLLLLRALLALPIQQVRVRPEQLAVQLQDDAPEESGELGLREASLVRVGGTRVQQLPLYLQLPLQVVRGGGRLDVAVTHVHAQLAGQFVAVLVLHVVLQLSFDALQNPVQSLLQHQQLVVVLPLRDEGADLSGEDAVRRLVSLGPRHHHLTGRHSWHPLQLQSVGNGRLPLDAGVGS